jgi:nucleoside-diphosphate-sugar epimerase
MFDDHYFTSSELIRTLMRHEVPGVARVKVPFADVRDIAEALVAALITPEAAGKRFCCVGAVCWMQEIALILKSHYANQGYRVPTSQIPDLFIRLLALFDKKVGLTVRALGWDYHLATDQARQILGWQPRAKEETILAMADSLIEFGMR